MTPLTLDVAPEMSPRPSLLDRLLDERRRGDCADTRRPARAVARAGAERSLDEAVTATWDALGAAEATACLICGGALQPRYGAGPRPVGARCADCGTELT